MTKYDVHLTEEREEKIKLLSLRRQMDLTVVLENVHDPHNIGAVMRTCDAVGIPKLHMIVNDARVWDKLELGINASSGARKWVDVYVYEECSKCFKDLRKDYDHIYGAYLGKQSRSLYSIDFTKPTALVFGNEHEGLSEEALRHLDGNFVIPQFGMVQSLNISVACAVSSYEALRQRSAAGMYDRDEMTEQQSELREDYRQRNYIQHNGAFARIVK